MVRGRERDDKIGKMSEGSRVLRFFSFYSSLSDIRWSVGSQGSFKWTHTLPGQLA